MICWVSPCTELDKGVPGQHEIPDMKCLVSLDIFECCMWSRLPVPVGGRTEAPKPGGIREADQPKQTAEAVLAALLVLKKACSGLGYRIGYNDALGNRKKNVWKMDSKNKGGLETGWFMIGQ